MEDLSEYLTIVDRDILDLVDKHISAMVEFERRGGIDPDARAKHEEFQRIVDLVHARVRQRMLNAETAAAETAERLRKRQQAHCPTCGVTRAVAIVGHARNPVANVICDVLVCSVCHSRFVNPVPNTWADKIKLLEHAKDQLTTVREDGTMAVEQAPDRERLERLVSDIERMRTMHHEQLQAERDFDLAQENAEKQLRATRDLLRHWKLQRSGLVGKGGAASEAMLRDGTAFTEPKVTEDGRP